jgi:hypothetical protein
MYGLFSMFSRVTETMFRKSCIRQPEPFYNEYYQVPAWSKIPVLPLTPLQGVTHRAVHVLNRYGSAGSSTWNLDE